jgi:hypothetical protein
MARQIIHTLESCSETARKCATRAEYYRNHNSSYCAARKNGWLDIVCAHFPDTASKKSVIVFGLEFASLGEALKHHGFPEHGAEMRTIRKENKISSEAAIEFMVSRKIEAQKRQEQKSQERLLIAKIRQQEDEAKAKEKAEADFSRQNFMQIKFCIACNKCFYDKERIKKNQTCSDFCAKINDKSHKNKGKARKRHKKYGTVYVFGITAEKVAKRDGMKCKICGIKVEKHLGKGWQPSGWSVGHIVPVSAGGATTWDNVQCECFSCNIKKGARIIENKVPQYRLFG